MRSKLTLAFACACALGVALACAATLQAETTPAPPAETETETVQLQVDHWQLQREIDRYRHETWRWQRLMGRRLTRNLKDPPANVEAKIAVWKRVALKTRSRAQNPPHKRQWLCIHRYEASWNANTGNGFFGGLQMNSRFQQQYGWHLLVLKGTADHWTPLEQMWVAERAHRSGRGFYPWPNTARYCGLI